MMTAALHGHTDCVAVLLTAGAQLEIQHTAIGSTALSLASQEGHQDIVEMMVKTGARMDACDNYGYCPLHAAADSNREEVVKTLVRLGCDPDMVSRRVGGIVELVGGLDIYVENVYF